MFIPVSQRLKRKAGTFSYSPVWKSRLDPWTSVMPFRVHPIWVKAQETWMALDQVEEKVNSATPNSRKILITSSGFR